jgi:hypothetical protein
LNGWNVLVPLIDGLTKLAFKFKAVCSAVDIGLSYIINITNPTIAFVIPLTVPVNVGLAKFAFKFNAVCCVVDTGLLASHIIYITQTNHYFCYSTYCTSKETGLAKFVLSLMQLIVHLILVY